MMGLAGRAPGGQSTARNRVVPSPSSDREHGYVADRQDPEGAREHAAAPSEVLRGHIRLAGHRRVSHGLFLPLVPGLTRDQEFLRDLQAWREVLPETAAFTHVTGARLLQWQLPVLPRPVPVFAAVAGDVSRPQRTGLVYSRLVRQNHSADVHGLPVDAPEEILLRAARDLGLLDLVIMTDSGRHLHHIDRERMSVVLASGRPGVRMLARAWDLSDHRAESAGESILRVFHIAMGIPVEPQAVLVDEKGHVVGRADLRITGTDDLSEYDGEIHRTKGQHKTDLRRERGLNDTAYRRHGYALDDLLNHPITVMHELDRRLKRPHRMARLRRWQRLVENSLFGERGKDRVLNRWRRVNGIIDWSEAA
jgi:hypothetical protein